MAANSALRLDLETHATDFVPGALAADTFRDFIREGDDQLKGLDEQLKDLDEQLKGPEDMMEQLRARILALEEKRAEVVKVRDLHRAFLAPVRKLAPEMLGEVFIQYLLASKDGPWASFKCDLPTSDGPTHDPPTADVRLPLLWVCRRWRRIAMGTPRLWRFVRLDASLWKPFDGVQVCLDNSGRLPLHVWTGNNRAVEMRLLFDNFHRVQEIDGLWICVIWGILSQNFFLQTPLLKVVSLRGPSLLWRPDLLLPRLHNFIQAPPIESLEMMGCASLLSVFCRKPGKLQHLKVADVEDGDGYISALLDILPLSSSLRSLDLGLSTRIITREDDLRIITLPHLRSMSVMGRVDNICWFLAVLDVPFLDCLTLDTHTGSSNKPVVPPWIHIRSFLQGDPPPLRFLTLKQISLGHGVDCGFLDFISRLSQLEYLRLDMCRVLADHLGAFILSHIPHANMVCPRLTTLSFNETELPGDILVKVVQSRAPVSGIPWENRYLRSVEARCPGLEDHYGALREIGEDCRGGLTLDLGPQSFNASDHDDQ